MFLERIVAVPDTAESMMPYTASSTASFTNFESPGSILSRQAVGVTLGAESDPLQMSMQRVWVDDELKIWTPPFSPEREPEEVRSSSLDADAVVTDVDLSVPMDMSYPPRSAAASSAFSFCSPIPTMEFKENIPTSSGVESPCPLMKASIRLDLTCLVQVSPL